MYIFSIVISGNWSLDYSRLSCTSGGLLANYDSPIEILRRLKYRVIGAVTRQSGYWCCIHRLSIKIAETCQDIESQLHKYIWLKAAEYSSRQHIKFIQTCAKAWQGESLLHNYLLNGYHSSQQMAYKSHINFNIASDRVCRVSFPVAWRRKVPGHPAPALGRLLSEDQPKSSRCSSMPRKQPRH